MAGDSTNIQLRVNEIGPFKGKYRFLSNFYSAEIEVDGIVYPSTEHAFQAMKTESSSDRLLISKAATPALARQIGKKINIRKDWNEIRLGVMEELLIKKFSIPHLRERLIETYPHKLIEYNFWHDEFWGVCGDRGQNNMGILLMKIRDSIVERSNLTNTFA